MSEPSAPPPDLHAAVRAVLLDQIDALTDEVARHLAARSQAVDPPGTDSSPPGAPVSSSGGGAAEMAKLAEELAQKRREAAEAVESSQRQCAEAEERAGKARELLAQLESARREQEAALAQSVADLEARRQEFDGYRQQGERSRQLLERLLPDWLRDGSLAAWKSRVEKGVYDAEASAVFGLLFAALHGYKAALRDSDLKILLDALRDVGRRLYAFLHEDDGHASEADHAHVAEQWARAINQECVGRCEVEVPIPGNAANNQWMFFQPRGGSSPDVLSVRSWCVRDAQRRPVHRAEVTV